MRPETKNLTSIVLDVETSSLIVTYSMPVEGGVAEFVGELPLDPADPATDQSLLTDTRLLVERITQLLAHGQTRKDCDTCTGNCCKTFDVVEVTAMDIHRMRTAGLDVDSLVRMFLAQTVTGVAGQLVLGKNNRCLSLDKNGRCSIYAARPEACREYSNMDCDLYERDPGKKRLKVIS